MRTKAIEKLTEDLRLDGYTEASANNGSRVMELLKVCTLLALNRKKKQENSELHVSERDSRSSIVLTSSSYICCGLVDWQFCSCVCFQR